MSTGLAVAVTMTTINPLSTIPADLREELQEALGIVPTFIRVAQPENARYWWQGLRDFQMSDQTALEPKVKELIGLAVAAQIPCEYCVSFHTEAARVNGATDAELQEAIFMAGLTRFGSTILNGSQLDQETFNKELKQIVAHVKQAMAAQRPGGNAPVRVKPGLKSEPVVRGDAKAAKAAKASSR